MCKKCIFKHFQDNPLNWSRDISASGKLHPLSNIWNAERLAARLHSIQFWSEALPSHFRMAFQGHNIKTPKLTPVSSCIAKMLFFQQIFYYDFLSCSFFLRNQDWTIDLNTFILKFCPGESRHHHLEQNDRFIVFEVSIICI